MPVGENIFSNSLSLIILLKDDRGQLFCLSVDSMVAVLVLDSNDQPVQYVSLLASNQYKKVNITPVYLYDFQKTFQTKSDNGSLLSYNFPAQNISDAVLIFKQQCGLRDRHYRGQYPWQTLTYSVFSKIQY